MHRNDDKRHTLRCAIYTRKSTEEGLEQAFNSLDAQREACRAYIQSQQHEGWKLDDTLYDDGGYSGGSMNRPALQQLLAEVKANKIDVIVVYKVDRLTRSLADFAKIVETMDEAGASFVSVTQSFNTTTSMGRLTLNVLLSFAQFEREIAGERIRDKIAASKKKGMWMGGVVPLGYRLEDRKLLIDEKEAEQVCAIFRIYLACGSLVALVGRLEDLGMRTKRRVSKTGKVTGGCVFRQGTLRWLLRNLIYRGLIVHKDNIWPGEHEAIVDETLWEDVQSHMDMKRTNKGAVQAQCPSLLAGQVQDGYGRKLTPSHATKGAKRYRYYVTATNEKVTAERPVHRLPAHDLERVVTGGLARLLRDPLQLAKHFPNRDLHDLIGEARVMASRLESNSGNEQRAELQAMVACVTVESHAVRIELKTDGPLGETDDPDILVSAVKIKSGNETKLVLDVDAGSLAFRDERLIRLVADAFVVRKRLVAGETIHHIAKERQQTPQWIGRLVRLGWLPPKLVEAIVEGKQPAKLTRRVLSGSSFDADWWLAQMAQMDDLRP